MFQRLVASGLFAGFAAGLLAAALHFAFVQKILLLGEQYETGALTHFAGAAASADAGHDHGAATGAEGTAEAGHDHGDAGHDHGTAATAGDGTGAEPSAFNRNMLTVLFYALAYSAYGLLLVAGMALARHFGATVDGRDGVLWGLAGFAAFQMAPAMGLAPELPGTIAAELGARQVWWWGTVLATATGLALLAYGRSFLTALVAGALLAAPHVIGAPHMDGFFGTAPPEVAAEFAARVLGNAMVTWAVMGWLAARFLGNASA